MSYSRFFSQRSLRRMPSAIRSLQPLLQLPGMISLGGGMPNPALFPFKELSFEAPAAPGATERETITLDSALLGRSLQYSSSFGVQDLLDQLKHITDRDHSPPYDYSIMVSTGSQDGLAKAFDMLIDEGDPVLVENPTYSGALSALFPLAPTFCPVEIDAHGIIPGELQRALESSSSNGKKPRVLYTIPTGQNPSGSTIPNERREDIYSIACEHDLLILEDDPYWNLQFRSPQDAPLRSFFSMDREKRVIRFDSLSKVLSSGIRMGWVSGPSELLERLQLDQQATCLHPCGVSQAMVAALLSHWGEKGWSDHVKSVQQFYGARRDKFAELAEKHLSGLPVSWAVPSAGMFFWFKLDGVEDTEELIKKRAVDEKVILVPGISFTPGGAASPFCRAAFSTASEEEMDTALERFAALLRS